MSIAWVFGAVLGIWFVIAATVALAAGIGSLLASIGDDYPPLEGDDEA